MAERHIIESGKVLKYEGVFSAKGIYDVIHSWASDKGYWPVEQMHAESLKPEGKFIEMIFYPCFKKLTDYAKAVLKIHIQMSEVQDVVLEQEGRKVKLKDGKVKITIQGFIETDYEARWEVKPLLYVIRTIFEKYVLTPFMHNFERTLREDMGVLEAQLKSYLNLSKFTR